jgi:hypothetical protein
LNNIGNEEDFLILDGKVDSRSQEKIMTFCKHSVGFVRVVL